MPIPPAASYISGPLQLHSPLFIFSKNFAIFASFGSFAGFSKMLLLPDGLWAGPSWCTTPRTACWWTTARSTSPSCSWTRCPGSTRVSSPARPPTTTAPTRCPSSSPCTANLPCQRWLASEISPVLDISSRIFILQLKVRTKKAWTCIASITNNQ